MDTLILKAADSTIQPLMDEIRKNAIQIARDQEKTEGRIPQPEAVLEKNAEAITTWLKDLIINLEELALIEQGFSLFLAYHREHPKGEDTLHDLQKAGQMLLEPTNFEELPVYETVQEMFGLSRDTINTLYEMGASFYQRRNYSDAAALFTLVTHLNTFFFSPWLSLGCCWQKENHPAKALHAFSMATLINPHHPLPYLYSAEQYLALEQKKLAEDSLERALKKMSKEDLINQKPYINYVQKQLKRPS